jgi:replication factor A1
LIGWYIFFAIDGKMKLEAMLPTSMAGEVISGKLQNLGLIHIVEYTYNNIQNQRCP